MVFQHELKGISYNTIARNLNVDASTVRRTVDLFWATVDVQKRPYPRSAANARQKLNDCAQLFIMYQIIDLPGIYLHEIQEALEEDLE